MPPNPTHCTFKETEPVILLKMRAHCEPHTKMYCDQKWNVKNNAFGVVLKNVSNEPQLKMWVLLVPESSGTVWLWNDSKVFGLIALPRVYGHFHHFFTELLFNFPTKTFLSLRRSLPDVIFMSS